MKVIAYTRPDGGVSVVVPAPQAKRADESEDEFVERIRLKDVPQDAADVVVLDSTELPSRATRNSWRIVNGKVVT